MSVQGVPLAPPVHGVSLGQGRVPAVQGTTITDRLPSIPALIVQAGGVIAAIVLVASIAITAYEWRQENQCVALGHVWSPVSPDGSLNQCWVQNTPRPYDP